MRVQILDKIMTMAFEMNNISLSSRMSVGYLGRAYKSKNNNFVFLSSSSASSSSSSAAVTTTDIATCAVYFWYD